MIGRGNNERALTRKDENWREMKTKEEVVQAFRRRMERTFKISDEKITDFNSDTKREVEEWLRQRRNQLRSKREIRITDTLTITANLIRDIFKSQREGAWTIRNHKNTTSPWSS